MLQNKYHLTTALTFPFCASVPFEFFTVCNSTAAQTVVATSLWGTPTPQSPPPESMLSPQQFGVRRGFHFCLHQISWSLVFSSMGPRRMAAGIVKTPGQPPVRHAPIFTVCCCWTRGGRTQVNHFLEVPISLHESYHNNSFSSLCSARSCYLWGLQCLTSHFSSLITAIWLCWQFQGLIFFSIPQLNTFLYLYIYILRKSPVKKKRWELDINQKDIRKRDSITRIRMTIISMPSIFFPSVTESQTYSSVAVNQH